MSNVPWMEMGGALLALGLLLWVPTRIRYDISSVHLRVTLFGLPLRRIKLTNIERVTKRHARWAEQWWNTWRPFRRRLMIRRHRGLIKNFVITPRFRYEFRAELERAVQRAKAPGAGVAAGPTVPIEVRQ